MCKICWSGGEANLKPFERCSLNWALSQLDYQSHFLFYPIDRQVDRNFVWFLSLVLGCFTEIPPPSTPNQIQRPTTRLIQYKTNRILTERTEKGDRLTICSCNYRNWLIDGLKRLVFFILINARVNDKIFRVNKSHISLTLLLYGSWAINYCTGGIYHPPPYKNLFKDQFDPIFCIGRVGTKIP